jgi:hypothetical protein
MVAISGRAQDSLDVLLVVEILHGRRHRPARPRIAKDERALHPGRFFL